MNLQELLEERIQRAKAPSTVICTLCDAKLPAGTPCVKLRAPINLIITTKIVEEYACKSCGELISHRMLSVARSL